MIDFNWFALYVGIGALLLILEPETAHAEIVEHTKYGNYCDVIIDRDVFTDEETTFLMCYGSDIGGDPPMRGYSITIFCRGDEEKLFLKAGIQFHAPGPIKVRYRFGKTQFKEETWSWTAKSGASTTLLSQAFLKNMTSTEYVVFEIGGKNRGIVKFTDHIKSGLADFRKRCMDASPPELGN